MKEKGQPRNKLLTYGKFFFTNLSSYSNQEQMASSTNKVGIIVTASLLVLHESDMGFYMRLYTIINSK